MKRVLSPRNCAIALASFFSFAMAPMVQATEDPKTTPVELKFLGNFRNKPVFELTFNNTGLEKDYSLHIRDEYGNSLYHENLSSKTASKKFMLNIEELEDDALKVVVSRKGNKAAVYTINRNSHVVEEVSVNKVN